MGAPGASAIGGQPGAGRPGRRSPVELLGLNAYWFALNLMWAALGISLLPLLMVQLVCGGDAACAHPLAVVGSFSPGKGVAEAIIVDLGLIVSVVVQPTAAALSDALGGGRGYRTPFMVVGVVLDLVFLAMLYVAGSWLALLAGYLLLQASSNLAQGPFQALLPDQVPNSQIGLASGLMGLMILLGTGCGTVLVALAANAGDARDALIAIGMVEVVTMAVTVSLVRSGAPRARRTVSLLGVARNTWSRDVLTRPGFVRLLASRLFLLMGPATVTAVGFLYMQDAFHLATTAALGYTFVAGAVVVAAGALATVPAGWASQRAGRKRVIYAGSLLGMLGLAGAVVAPTPGLAVACVAPIGLGAGAFLSVDWALLTEIVPLDEAGRYLGLSNVATAAAGALASGIGLVIVDAGNRALGVGAGPRLALLAGCADFALGMVLLVAVPERRRSPLRSDPLGA